MSEIICIHVGGCGIKTGLKFWQELGQTMKEHKTNEKTQGHSQLAYFQKFFTQNIKGEYTPRGVFIDNDMRSADLVLKSDINVDKKLILTKNSSSYNLFVQGHYLSGAQLTQPLQDLLRKQVQKCDILSGFILTQSPAGGTGSGVGSKVETKLRQNYCASIVEEFKVMPGSIQANFRNMNSVQIYNTILSTHYSIESTDLIYCFQNSAAFNILANKGLTHTNFQQINNYYGHLLNQHVSAYIFPGRQNTNQRKRAVNLIPFPRIKTICGSLSQPRSQKDHIKSSLQYRNKLMRFQSQHDIRIFNLNLNVRDSLTSENQIDRAVKTWLTTTQNTFVQWIPNNLHMSMQNSPKSGSSTWALINGSNNIKWIQKIAELFTAQFRRRAFIHHYVGGGMDEMEFTEAESNCNDLVSEYVPYSGDYMMEEDQEFYNEMS